jgi:hypothetical protein
MNTTTTQPSAVSAEHLNHPRSVAAFRSVNTLVASYLGLSVLTLVAIVVFRNDPAIVNAAVWIRGTLVVASALLMFLFALSAARGSRKGFLRVRLVSAIMVVAIAVIISLPGTFPLWMKIEQAVCGLILLAVVVIVNGKHLRSVFASK